MPSRQPGYAAWSQMKKRCYAATGDYRGKVIVCERWRISYAAFIEDMGLPPGLGYSIDRIDNEGNYEPTNCRWATTVEQNRNRSITQRVTVDGRTQTLQEWADEVGLPYGTLWRRMKRGYSPEQIVAVDRHERVRP